MHNWTSREGCRIKLATAEEPVNATAKRAGDCDGWRSREINSSVIFFMEFVLKNLDFRAEISEGYRNTISFCIIQTLKLLCSISQLQNAAIMYLLVPSASQESLILLANVQVPSREEIFLKKFDWREDGLTGYVPEPCLPKPSSDFNR